MEQQSVNQNQIPISLNNPVPMKKRRKKPMTERNNNQAQPIIECNVNNNIEIITNSNNNQVSLHPNQIDYDEYNMNNARVIPHSKSSQICLQKSDEKVEEFTPMNRELNKDNQNNQGFPTQQLNGINNDNNNFGQPNGPMMMKRKKKKKSQINANDNPQQQQEIIQEQLDIEVKNNDKPLVNSLINVPIPIEIKNLTPTKALVNEQVSDNDDIKNKMIENNNNNVSNANNIPVNRLKRKPMNQSNDQQYESTTQYNTDNIQENQPVQKQPVANMPLRKKKKKIITPSDNNDQIIILNNPEINNIQSMNIDVPQARVMVINDNAPINNTNNQLNNNLNEINQEQVTPNTSLRKKKKKSTPLPNSLPNDQIIFDNYNNNFEPPMINEQNKNINVLEEEKNQIGNCINTIQQNQDNPNNNIPLRKKKKKQPSPLINDQGLPVNIEQIPIQQEELLQGQHIYNMPIQEMSNNQEIINHFEPQQEQQIQKINMPMRKKKKKPQETSLIMNDQMQEEIKQDNNNLTQIALQEAQTINIVEQNKNIFENPKESPQEESNVNMNMPLQKKKKKIKPVTLISNTFNDPILQVNEQDGRFEGTPEDNKHNNNTNNNNENTNIVVNNNNNIISDPNNNNPSMRKKKKKQSPPLNNNEQVIQDINPSSQRIPIQQEDIPPIKDVSNITENNSKINQSNNNLIEVYQNEKENDKNNTPTRKKKKKQPFPLTNSVLNDHTNQDLNDGQQNPDQREDMSSIEDKNIISRNDNAMTGKEQSNTNTNHNAINQQGMNNITENEITEGLAEQSSMKKKRKRPRQLNDPSTENIIESSSIIENQHNTPHEITSSQFQSIDQTGQQSDNNNQMKRKKKKINNREQNSIAQSESIKSQEEIIQSSYLPLHKMPTDRADSIKALDQRLYDLQHQQDTHTKSIQTTNSLKNQQALNNQSSSNNYQNQSLLHKDSINNQENTKNRQVSSSNRINEENKINKDQLPILNEKKGQRSQSVEANSENYNQTREQIEERDRMRKQKRKKVAGSENSSILQITNEIIEENNEETYKNNNNKNNNSNIRISQKKEETIRNEYKTPKSNYATSQNETVNVQSNRKQYKSNELTEVYKDFNGNSSFVNLPNINNQQKQNKEEEFNQNHYYNNQVQIENKEMNTIHNNRKSIERNKETISMTNDLMSKSRSSINKQNLNINPIPKPNNRYYYIEEQIHIDLLSKKKNPKIYKESLSNASVAYNDNNHKEIKTSYRKDEEDAEDNEDEQEEDESLINKSSQKKYSKPYYTPISDNFSCQTYPQKVKYSTIPLILKISFECSLILHNKYDASKRLEILKELNSVQFKQKTVVRNNILQRKELEKLSQLADHYIHKMNLTNFAAKIISLKKHQSYPQYMSVTDNQIMNAKALAQIIQRENFRLNQISSYPNLNLLEIQSEDYTYQLDHISQKIKRLKHDKEEHVHCDKLNHDIVKSIWNGKDDLRQSQMINDDVSRKIKEIERRSERATLYQAPLHSNINSSTTRRRNRSCENVNESINMTDVNFQYGQGISMFTPKENNYLQEAFKDNKADYNRLMKLFISIQNTKHSKELQFQIKMKNQMVTVNELTAKIDNLKKKRIEEEERRSSEMKEIEDMKEDKKNQMRIINETLVNIEKLDKENNRKKAEIDELNSQIALCKRIIAKSEQNSKKKTSELPNGMNV